MSMMFSHFTIGDVEYQVSSHKGCEEAVWPRIVDKVQREVMRKHHKAAGLVPKFKPPLSWLLTLVIVSGLSFSLFIRKV